MKVSLYMGDSMFDFYVKIPPEEGGSQRQTSIYPSITKPEFAEAFALIRQHAEDTSMRKTNRAGHETWGTHLVEGILDCPVSFYVR